MRKPPLIPTKRHRVVRCVLVLGNQPGLEDLCRISAERAAGARVISSDAADMSTRAAQWRPFAIVAPSSMASSDPEEFAALARSVNAELVTIAPERIGDPSFQNELTETLRKAAERHKTI